jgi:UPF0755 protein
MKYSNSFLTCLSFFLLFLILSALFLFDWIRFLNTPLISKNMSMDYILPSGTSVRVLANDLNKLGVLNHPGYFELLAYLKDYANHLHAGEYRFESGETPEMVLKKMAEGKVLWRQVTFIEGWTFVQMLDVLEKNPLIIHNFVGLPPMMIMTKLNIPGINPEGLFFPDTYQYTAGMSDKTILLQAYQLQQNHLNHEWENRAEDLPYQTSYEALIAASIIEKEAHVNNERAEIAGVIVRRLEKNMLLQMDPTVMYAMSDNFHPPLRKENLKIDSPYNTYLYTGLPPTPICSPSLASLHAALHPNLNNNALYFVSKGNGTHQFSATYKEHKQAIQKYE